MHSEVSWLFKPNVTSIVAGIILSSLAGAAVLLLFLAVRRGMLRMQVRHFDDLAFGLHKQWREIVRGEVPADLWRNDAVQRQIVQTIVIQEIGAATDKDRVGLQEFLRSHGMVESSVQEVFHQHGAKRRRALLALGAMRVPEAIAPLTEALDDWQLDTRMAALQGLGSTHLPAAAAPIIESLMVGALKLPVSPVENALVQCYLDRPNELMPYLRRSRGDSREMLARVASELATANMADEMLVLATDAHPEIRASAARALAVAPLPLAIPALAELVRDDVWFVRLRATSALREILHPRTIPILLEAIRDPNRLVRIRAAAALSTFERDRIWIVQSVVDSRDRYALHSIISALELNGGLTKVMEELADPLLRDEAANRLLSAIREGVAGLWSTRPSNPAVEKVFP